jgi:hypothetical protein
MLYGRGGASIEQICGGCQGFSPVWWWHGSVEQQGENDVVDGAERAFGFAILLTSVGAQEAQGDFVTRKKISGGPVDELSVVIRLQSFGSDAELRMSKSV